METNIYFPKLTPNKDKIQAFNMLREDVVGNIVASYMTTYFTITDIISRMNLSISTQDFLDILEFFGVNHYHEGLLFGYEIDEFVEFITNYESSDENFEFFKIFISQNSKSIQTLHNLLNQKKFQLFLNQDLELLNNENSSRERYYNSIAKFRNSSIQSEFRKNLLMQFESKCAICNIHNEVLLIASHIIPYHMCWEDSELPEDPENGLLLCALHDSMFESGRLISFNNKGNILINPIIDSDLDHLGISNETRLNKKHLTYKRIKNLELHTKLFYKKVGEVS